jgi:hypothetical protein
MYVFSVYRERQNGERKHFRDYRPQIMRNESNAVKTKAGAEIRTRVGGTTIP